MSNEFKDWYNDFTEEQKANYELCMKYPILIPHHRWTGTVRDDYMYEYTELDGMPSGWRIAFGEDWAKEVQGAINKLPEKDRDKIYITDIKEKFGYLHTYFSRYTDDLDIVIRKYEKLSRGICICCGKPATKMSTGWISPWCDDCVSNIYDNIIDIYEWVKRLEDER